MGFVMRNELHFEQSINRPACFGSKQGDGESFASSASIIYASKLSELMTGEYFLIAHS